MEKSKIKYQRAYLDWEQVEQDYNRAEQNNDLSRNQVDR